MNQEMKNKFWKLCQAILKIADDVHLTRDLNDNKFKICCYTADNMRDTLKVFYDWENPDNTFIQLECWSGKISSGCNNTKDFEELLDEIEGSYLNGILKEIK